MRAILVAAAAAGVLFSSAAVAGSPYKEPSAWPKWFESATRYDGTHCCGQADAHGVPIEGHDSRHEKLVWRYYMGAQPKGVTDPKDPDFIVAQLYKYNQWWSITSRQSRVWDTSAKQPAELTNPTGATIIWYSDYPPTGDCPKCGNINIFCAVFGPNS